MLVGEPAASLAVRQGGHRSFDCEAWRMGLGFDGNGVGVLMGDAEKLEREKANCEVRV